MGTNSANKLAMRVLEPLARYYGRPDIEEIVVNREGEVWTKPRRADWERQDAPEITYEYVAHRLCRVLANINNARFREDEMPIVSCELPGLHFRFQAVVGPNVRYELADRRGIALSVRALTADDSITFKNWGLETGATLPGVASVFRGFEGIEDHLEKIVEAVRRGLTILVSGGMSTGKTTFLNQLIKLLSANSRIITVEDAREVTVPQANRIHLMVPRTKSASEVGYNEILDAIVRLTPDFIILGEVSVRNAGPLFSLMGKGHQCITTIHAGTPEEAKQAFINNMAMAGAGFDARATMGMLESQIGCIIQLDRRDGSRRVIDISFPAKESHDRSEKSRLSPVSAAL